MSDGAIHRLSVPVSTPDGSMIRAVVIRQPRGKDIKRLRARLGDLREVGLDGDAAPAKFRPAVRSMIEAASVLTDIGPDLAGELDFSDLVAVCDHILPHLARFDGRGQR